MVAWGEKEGGGTGCETEVGEILSDRPGRSNLIFEGGEDGRKPYLVSEPGSFRHLRGI